MTEAKQAASAAAAVRDPMWRGWQALDALWWPADVLPAPVRTARMLAAWHPGCRAYRFAAGDMLCFARAQPLQCETMGEVPMRRLHGTLYSAPLTDEERAALPAMEIGLVAGAAVVGLRFAQGEVLDLSEAIALDAYRVLEPFNCHVASPVLDVAQLQGKDVRSVLGRAIPPRSAEGEAFLRAMAGARTADALRDGIAAVREGMLGAVVALLARWLPGSGIRVPAAASGGIPARQRAQRRPSAWRDTLARLAAISRVGKLIGYRHGAYLRRMMAMFDRGDLDEALRNALPVDATGQSLGQAFGTPERRESLQLSGRIGQGASLDLGEDLTTHLRRMYREAFAALNRKGRIDEAVFVLAELLNARQEALDYLVEHGRHAQAAELAMGWEMPPALIIRLLMLGGDVRRATQVARRDRAFADAVSQLQGAHPALAAQLRLEWGHALVESGDWLEAVEVVWPLREARDLALQWLLAAEQAGAALSARALVQRASLLPDTLQQYADRIEALADPAADPQPRAALANALLAIGGNSAALRRLAACVLPAVAADCSAGRNGLGRSDLERLLKMAADPCLKSDMPPWRVAQAGQPTPFWRLRSPLALALPAAGVQRIHDAAVLPDRQYLVALGEAGAAVLDAHGRVVQHYAVPAYRLVLAASGQVALALAPRERVSRIARLDLTTRSSIELGALALQFAAPTLIGTGWTVVVDGRILVIDVGKGLMEVLWHVGDLPGSIVAAAFFEDCEVFLVRTAETLQEWTYMLPHRRLRGRDDIVLQPDVPVMPHRLGGMQQPRLEVNEDGANAFVFRNGNARGVCVLPPMPSETVDARFVALEHGMLAGVRLDQASRYFIVRFSDGDRIADLALPSGLSLQAREQPGHLLLFTEDGRLLDIDLSLALAHALSLH
ncbi:hypothetical protein NB699_003823 [Xanthomonas sacchari]|uniref:BpX6 domain-containing protein n=1 Tax=Xanthomonas sacchari TaxID=56458 RepID=A0AA46SUL9_9XANT|nr:MULTISPECIES: bpX6 domain-containing protein [Xanthomonas]KAB7781821.1 hypothetical protein CEK66_00050 [Xanthomonas sp. LMG 12460]MCW0368840.1 hypothetical protein [Xanthomonas sacchari]MCW0441348.1 hypothetical protein [Xanthomonas sacchari]UYK88861.1 bpX6 domain-containing protein [Xanthomonas sacchari]